MKREVEEEDPAFDQQKQRRLERIRDDLLSKLREYGQGSVFMEVVKYLSIEDAYALSKLDDEINVYFHKYGVWEEYVRDHVRRRYFYTDTMERLTLEAIVELFSLQNEKFPNYLWILVIFKIFQQRIAFYHFRPSGSPGVPLITVVDHAPKNEVYISFRGPIPPRIHSRIHEWLVRSGWEHQFIDDYTKGRGVTVQTPRANDILALLYALVQAGLYIDTGGTSEDFYIRSQLIGAGGAKRERDDDDPVVEPCINDEDPISHEPIAELDPDAIVRLGRHCYDVETLIEWIRHNPTNPMTRAVLTEEELMAIVDIHVKWLVIKRRKAEERVTREVDQLLRNYYRSVEERFGEQGEDAPRFVLNFLAEGRRYRIATHPGESVERLRQLVYNYILTVAPGIMIQWRAYYENAPNPNIIRLTYLTRELRNGTTLNDYNIRNGSAINIGVTILTPDPWVY